jgi:ArsR family transcriptional regulator
MRELVKIAKALSDETRIRMLKLLLERNICVREMQEIFHMSQPQVSRSLKILTDAGFLKRWREGKCVVYFAERDGNDIFSKVLLDSLSKSFNDNPVVTEDRERMQQALALLLREKAR